MWDDFWLSFKKAFELMGSDNKLLDEVVTTTLEMTLQSTLWAFIIGMPIGILIASNSFKGKKIIVTIQRTLMGLPPVAVGILVYILFRGVGPFGNLGLMYSVKLMVIAQVILIAPVVAGMTESAVTPITNRMLETAKGLRINPVKKLGLIINESKYQLVSVLLFAFARSMAEVGAVQIVGGNILHKTRVMTTTIMMGYNTGSYQLAVALGIILMLIVLAANVLATILENIGKRNFND